MWQGACMAGGHVWQGGMCDRGHAWQGACMAGGVHGRGACVAGWHAQYLGFNMRRIEIPQCAHLLMINSRYTL